MGRCVRERSVSLDPLARSARAAAASFRLGMEAQASEALARLVDGLLALLAEQPALASALDPLVGAIVAAQERGDPVGLADRLEHELLPALSRALSV